MAAGFVGTVSVTWLEQPGDDRDMKLNDVFSFKDAAGLEWKVKKSAVINGASIPKVFWSTFGSPFIGDYRRASVVHDYFCDIRTRPSDATHKMFLEACIAGGVGQIKAKTMYTMVKTFGPSWITVSNGLAINNDIVVGKGKMLSYTHTMTDEQFATITKWIERENPSVEAIDAEIEKQAQQVIILPPSAPSAGVSIESF